MKIKILTKDNKEYEMSVNNVLKSNVIVNILGWNDLSIDDIMQDNIPEDSIPLNDITYECLCNINEYLNKYNEKKIDTHFEDWEKKYINEFNDEKLFDIIMGSNYLEIKSLLDLGCKTVAEQIKQCKTPQEIRKRFNIKNDFTPEEEEEIRKENTWCED